MGNCGFVGFGGGVLWGLKVFGVYLMSGIGCVVGMVGIVFGKCYVDCLYRYCCLVNI